MQEITPEATSPGEPAQHSLAAAADAFAGLLFPTKGKAKKTPGETSPEPTGAPAAEDEESEVTASEDTDVEVPEDEPEVTDPDAEDTEGDEPKETEAPETTDEETDEVETEEPKPTVRARKLRMPDGTEQEVTEDEAYNGYLRTADYTRKSQANAELKKQAETETAQARDARTKYAAQLEQVKQAMDRMVPKEPDWSALRARVSPEEFSATFADWQQFSKNRAAVEVEQKRIADEAKADFDKTFAEFRTQEIEKLLLAIPEWRDESRGKAEVAEMAVYGRSVGFADEEVNSVVDHRLLLLLRKAMLWDKLQTTKPKVEATIKKSKIKSAPPGSPAGKPKPASDEKRAKDALQKSGSVKDAADVFSTMLSRRGPRAV